MPGLRHHGLGRLFSVRLNGVDCAAASGHTSCYDDQYVLLSQCKLVEKVQAQCWSSTAIAAIDWASRHPVWKDSQGMFVNCTCAICLCQLTQVVSISMVITVYTSKLTSQAFRYVWLLHMNTVTSQRSIHTNKQPQHCLVHEEKSKQPCVVSQEPCSRLLPQWLVSKPNTALHQ